MSRHIIVKEIKKIGALHGKKCLIIMGWDKPLQRFYCDVFEYESYHRKDCDIVLYYDNLTDMAILGKDPGLNYYLDILKDEFDITLDESIINEIIDDEENDVVNKIKNWNI